MIRLNYIYQERFGGLYIKYSKIVLINNRDATNGSVIGRYVSPKVFGKKVYMFDRKQICSHYRKMYFKAKLIKFIERYKQYG